MRLANPPLPVECGAGLAEARTRDLEWSARSLISFKLTLTSSTEFMFPTPPRPDECKTLPLSGSTEPDLGPRERDLGGVLVAMTLPAPPRPVL